MEILRPTDFGSKKSILPSQSIMLTFQSSDFYFLLAVVRQDFTQCRFVCLFFVSIGEWWKAHHNNRALHDDDEEEEIQWRFNLISSSQLHN